MGQNKANFSLKKFMGKNRNIFDLQSWSRTSCVFQSTSFEQKFNGREPRCVKWEMIEKRNVFED